MGAAPGCDGCAQGNGDDAGSTTAVRTVRHRESVRAGEAGVWQAGRRRQSIGVNSRARVLLFAWVQRGSLAHTVGGRGWLAGEHVSAADRQHHARTRWGEFHRRWGPPLSTIAGLTRRQQPQHVVGSIDGDRDDSCHGAISSTGDGHAMPPGSSCMSLPNIHASQADFAFGRWVCIVFRVLAGLSGVSGWFCGGVVLPFFFWLAMDVVCLQCVAA